jgi:hypothetical protein
MDDVLASMRDRCGLMPGSILVDVGSGMARYGNANTQCCCPCRQLRADSFVLLIMCRPLLHAMVMFGTAETIGIEMDPVKHDKAVEFVRRVIKVGTCHPGTAFACLYRNP